MHAYYMHAYYMHPCMHIYKETNHAEAALNYGNKDTPTQRDACMHACLRGVQWGGVNRKREKGSEKKSFQVRLTE